MRDRNEGMCQGEGKTPVATARLVQEVAEGKTPYELSWRTKAMFRLASYLRSILKSSEWLQGSIGYSETMLTCATCPVQQCLGMPAITPPWPSCTVYSVVL